MDCRMKILRLLGVLEVVSGLTVGALNVPDLADGDRRDYETHWARNAKNVNILTTADPKNIRTSITQCFFLIALDYTVTFFRKLKPDIRFQKVISEATIHFFIWRFAIFHIGFFALSLLHTIVGITALLAATSTASHSCNRRLYPIHFMGTIIGVGYSLIFFSTLAFEYDTVSFPKSALDVARKTNILTRSNDWYIQAMYSALQAVWLVSTGCLCLSGGIVLCAWKGAVHQELGVPLCLHSHTLPGTRYSRAGCSDSSVVLSSFGGSKVSLGVEKERQKTELTKAGDTAGTMEGCSFIEA